jgi:RNA polymerase-interacting CarD/CdnL/TRCF family regulator
MKWSTRLNPSKAPHTAINVGDKIIYSTNGIGKLGSVIRVESRTIGGKPTDFFVVRMKDDPLTILTPKSFPDIKLRKLSNKTNVEAAYHILKNNDVVSKQHTIHSRWDRCVKEAKAILGYSAPLFGQAECLIYLNKIKNKRNLSFEERILLQEIKDSFLSEVSEILCKPKTELEVELDNLIN